jgi:hypothetical protein
LAAILVGKYIEFNILDKYWRCPKMGVAYIMHFSRSFRSKPSSYGTVGESIGQSWLFGSGPSARKTKVDNQETKVENQKNMKNYLQK